MWLFYDPKVYLGVTYYAHLGTWLVGSFNENKIILSSAPPSISLQRFTPRGRGRGILIRDCGLKYMRCLALKDGPEAWVWAMTSSSWLQKVPQGHWVECGDTAVGCREEMTAHGLGAVVSGELGAWEGLEMMGQGERGQEEL